jgi:competence ComEA-like helix-hairpin-helix protein
MNDPESRSVFRAAAILLLVSTLRWVGVQARAVAEGPALAAVGGAGPIDRTLDETSTVLGELERSTREATEEAARRNRPLEEDERIDPNRASHVELDRLPGIGPSTADAIVAARDTGTVFRTPRDLLTVRGIGPAVVARLEPVLDLSVPPRRPRSAQRGGEALDINRAGAGDLERLPGVGPALARRIVEARETGPFRRVEELTRVSGIGGVTVERLRPFVVVRPPR